MYWKRIFHRANWPLHAIMTFRWKCALAMVVVALLVFSLKPYDSFFLLYKFVVLVRAFCTHSNMKILLHINGTNCRGVNIKVESTKQANVYKNDVVLLLL